jgi:hypothetical protein
MRLPFSEDQFFDVFRLYNEAVWPAQWLFNVLSLVVIALAVMGSPRAPRAVPAILAALWLWMGAVYHLVFFADVNGAAYGFGALFILQGVVFAWLALRSTPLIFTRRRDAAAVGGWLLVLYALVVYPAVGLSLGHVYPASPTFGLPCPTTIFTIGLLLWAKPRIPGALLVIPMAWSVVGASAVSLFGVMEDAMLPVVGIVGGVLVVWKGRRQEGERARAPGVAS